MTRTLLLSLLAIASVASAQPMVGESLHDTMVRERFQRQLEEMREDQDNQTWRLHMDHQDQDDRLDSIRRQLDELDNTGLR